MASTSTTSFYTNLSLCVYIGNTIKLDDDALLNYCSRFGTILPSSFEKDKFCDFHIIEFSNSEHLKNFLNTPIHKINKTILDVKLYKHILTNNDILNIDRKFFIGPVFNKNDINTIVQFYKIIDPLLYNYLSEQDKQVYLLFEFSNRQSVTTIFEKQTIPITIENRTFYIYKPTHPKEFVHKIISMKNKQNQIYIQGLIPNITQLMLMDYFHKRAPVIACHILLNNPKCAVMEFNDEKTVRKILDVPNVRLQGANLVLSKATRQLASLLSSADNSDNDDEVQSTIMLKTPVLKSIISPPRVLNQSPVFVLRSIPPQENIQQRSVLFVNPTPPPIVTEPILIPSPDNNEAGWSSPPRTIISHCPSIDQPSVRSSSNPSAATTTSINTDLACRLTTTDLDIKPIRKVPSNNILHFVEQFQNELDQIKDEYMLKFAKDRSYIEQEINLLVNEERQTFDKLNGYLSDNRQRIEKRNSNKRKYSPSSSPH